MANIVILEHVQNCDTANEGIIIRDILHNKLLASDDKINVYFTDVKVTTSSFINAALVSLLNDYSYNQIKNRITIKDSNTVINQIIKRRFSFEVQKLEK